MKAGITFFSYCGAVHIPQAEEDETDHDNRRELAARHRELPDEFLQGLTLLQPAADSVDRSRAVPDVQALRVEQAADLIHSLEEREELSIRE